MSRKAACLVAMALVAAGCSYAAATPETPASSPPPMEVPTPTPTPVAQPSAKLLVAACSGKSVPGADSYQGDRHPLVVVDGGKIPLDYTVNESYAHREWESPIQLVVCLDASKWTQYKDCGKVDRFWTEPGSWKMGGIGRLYLMQESRQVRVVLATTGKVILRKTFTGARIECATALTDYGPPDYFGAPWHVHSTPLKGDGQIESFVATLSLQQVWVPSPSGS